MWLDSKMLPEDGGSMFLRNDGILSHLWYPVTSMVSYHITTWRRNSEFRDVNFHVRENLKSRNIDILV